MLELKMQNIQKQGDGFENAKSTFYFHETYEALYVTHKHVGRVSFTHQKLFC